MPWRACAVPGHGPPADQGQAPYAVTQANVQVDQFTRIWSLSWACRWSRKDASSTAVDSVTTARARLMHVERPTCWARYCAPHGQEAAFGASFPGRSAGLSHR